jgi:cytoskeleton protein RodZ
MSDFENASAVTANEPVMPAVEPSAGMLLRRAREAAGLHVAALAVSMKIPVKKLEALEADRLGLQLDAVFVRAFASSVCRALKIDPTPVLAKLPQNAAPRLNVGRNEMNTPFHSHGRSKRFSVPAFLTKPAVLVVLALLVAAVVVLLMPESPTAEPRENTAIPSQSAPTVMPAIVADTQPIVAAMPAVPTASAPVASIASSPAQDQITSPVAPVALSPIPLVSFKARGTSWVEVTDAKGIVQIRKTLAPGETLGASGALPLVVVIGRVDAIEVEVHGKPFSLSNIVKDNVARFEVKQ